MGLLSIFQRNKQTAAKPAKSRAKSPVRQAPAANPADTAEAYRDARARARRRLMGATVLLLIGVIGFPLLFETQPRPIPVDLPIEIPARNGTSGVEAPAAPTRGRSAASVVAPPVAATSATGVPESVSYDNRAASATPAPLPPSAAPVGDRSRSLSALATALTPGVVHGSDAAAASAAAAAASGVQAAAYAKPKPPRPSAPAAASRQSPVEAHVPPTLPPPPQAAPSGDAAAALLAGKPAPKPSEAAADGGRFVVQIGAFADDAKMRETRGKVEKLGMKTYTQSVDTPAGKRVRVRVGPFPSKAEADKAAARIKGDGLPAAVLAL